MDDWSWNAESYDDWVKRGNPSPSPDVDGEDDDDEFGPPIPPNIAEHNAWVLANNEEARRTDAGWRFGFRGIVSDVAEPVQLAPRLAGETARIRERPLLRQRKRLNVTAFATDDELRVFLAEQTRVDFAELVRPLPRGRLDGDKRARRAELARVVALARAQGAGFEPLARVLRRSLDTVYRLARDGERTAA